MAAGARRRVWSRRRRLGHRGRRAGRRYARDADRHGVRGLRRRRGLGRAPLPALGHARLDSPARLADRARLGPPPRARAPPGRIVADSQVARTRPPRIADDSRLPRHPPDPRRDQSLSPRQAELDDAGADVRWVIGGAVHLTIQFLGDVRESEVPQIESGLAEQLGALSPFEIECRGLGIVPQPEATAGGVGRASRRRHRHARGRGRDRAVAARFPAGGA